MKKIRLMILVSAMMLFTLACNTNRSEKPSSTGTEFADNSQYTCPMHPEVLSDDPGTCPKCGMKLEKVKEKSADTTAMPNDSM